MTRDTVNALKEYGESLKNQNVIGPVLRGFPGTKKFPATSGPIEMHIDLRIAEIIDIIVRTEEAEEGDK